MDLRQLNYFLAVARHEHMTRASRALFVSQPALSQQIAALERDLGIPLFDRVGRGLELTAAGRVLQARAQRIVEEVDSARAALDDLRGTVRGEIVVAAIQTAGATVLVQAMTGFHARHPGVVVRVREERADAVVEQVLRGEANLGVTYLPAEAPEGVEMEPLHQEELVLVVPLDHPLAGSELAAAQVADLPLVVPPGGYCLRKGIDAVLDEAGARQRVVAEIASMEGISQAVRSGVGVAILPLRYIEPRAAREELAVVRLVDPVPRRTVGVVRSAQRHACTATRAFMEVLREVGGEATSSLQLPDPGYNP